VLGAEQDIIAEYVQSGQVKYVFVPILDHADRSVQAHQAAECAAEQGQFWPLHDIFFEELGDLARGEIRQVIKEKAQRLPLDHERFNACVDEQRYVELVQAQDEQRRAIGVRTRPTIAVNDQVVVGPQPFSVFKELIDPLVGGQN
jgi:protein-disulfide isomerase